MMPVNPNPARRVTGRRLVIAEHQEGVRPLPAWSIDDDHGSILTRWHMTAEERERIAMGADLWVRIETFGHPVQPLAIATRGSDVVEGWPDE